MINLWGDVNAPGRFLVPTGTTLIELIPFARSPASFQTAETIFDWSKLRLEVNVSRRNQELNINEVVNFRFRSTQQLPPGILDFTLQENNFITLEVKRRPALVDCMRIIGPIATVAATLDTACGQALEMIRSCGISVHGPSPISAICVKYISLHQ